MDKFGTLKNKILEKLTESYQNQNKDDIKRILSLIKEDKTFKEVYLFYEDLENKYFDDKETAKLFVEEMILLLREKTKNSSVIYKKLVTELKDVKVKPNILYDNVDQLLEEDNLSNIDKKILSKKWIVEYLTTPKQKQIDENSNLVHNESLLYAVLTNNFNALYENTLSDSEKSELKEILSIKNEDLESSINVLKEEIQSKISQLLVNDINDELLTKLNEAKKEIESMTTSRFNYYKLKQLKSNLS